MLSNIFDLIKNYHKIFLEGFLVTLLLALLTVIIGIILGMLLALMNISKIKVFKVISKVYIEVLRGLPLLLQLWIIYIVGINLGLSAFLAIVIALGLNSGAYVAEIIRSGIQAVDPGQREAGVSLGLSSFRVMYKIILPQAIKNIVPALGNELVTVIKETSLATTFYIGDLMTVNKNIQTITYLSFEPLIIAGMFYLVATLTLSKLITILEKRLKKSDKNYKLT